MDRHINTVQHARETTPPVKGPKRLAKELGKRHRNPTQGSGLEANAVIRPKYAKSGFAQPYRLVEHGLEDGDEVAGRAIDGLQYLGGRGLLLQCLARLVDQPRVLHCDNRLRREVLD